MMMFDQISEVTAETPPSLLIPMDQFSQELHMLTGNLNLAEMAKMEGFLKATPNARIVALVGIVGGLCMRYPAFQAVLKETTIVPNLKRLSEERRAAVVAAPDTTTQNPAPQH